MKNLIILLCLCSFFGCHNNSNSINNVSKLDSLNLLIELDSLNIQLLNQRAEIYFNQNKIFLAKDDIDQAYSIFRNNTDILLNRANIYFALNETRISKESWERCLKLDPNNIDCRQNLTELLCLVGYPKCELMIDTLSILNNGIVSPALIVLLKENRNYKTALKLLKNLLIQSPEDKETLNLLSIIYSDTSMYNSEFNINKAENYFRKIMRLYPHYSQVYYNFGKHKQNILEYDSALFFYNEGVTRIPNDKQIYYNMGFCSMQLENYMEAIDYFSQAISIDNSFLLAYHARAYLYELINNQEKAISDWKNCLMLHPAYIPALKAIK